MPGRAPGRKERRVKVYRYPKSALAGDYVRSAIGLAVGLGVLLSVPATPAIIIVAGGLTVLFGYFGLRTVQRHVVKVAVTDEEICNSGFLTRTLSWGDLEALKLRYYGTKRQDRGGGGGGFMQMTLRGRNASFVYESSLGGFRSIAWRAAKAMRENGISVDPTSAGNLLAIGLDADGEKPPPDDEGVFET